MSITAQAYLNTRITAMSTNLLGIEQLRELARCSLDELAIRFQLQSLLDEQLDKRARSRAVEQSLIQALLAEMTILIRPMPPREQDLLLAWGHKAALFNLKTLIRGKLFQLDQAEIREHLYDLPDHVRLASHQELFRAESVLELLRTLEQGPHPQIARQARKVYEQKHDLFALEAAIDQRYHAELIRQAMQFQDDSAHPLRQLLGAMLDGINLLWLLRFRFTYRLSPSETFFQLVPSPKLLHRDRLLQLANLDSFEHVLEALPAPLNNLLACSTNLIDVQRRIDAYQDERARRILASSHSGIARALAYLVLRESNLLQLFALIQGRLLGLSPELIAQNMELAQPKHPVDGLSATI